MSFELNQDVVSCGVLIAAIWLLSVYENEIFEAFMRLKKGILKRLTSRAQPEKGLGFRLPRFPHHMRIIRHPDGQQETLPLFERD